MKRNQTNSDRSKHSFEQGGLVHDAIAFQGSCGIGDRAKTRYDE
jgi:hypothetical protein